VESVHDKGILMNLKKFFIQLLINAFGFFVATSVLNGQGIDMQGENSWLSFLILALIFGVINAVLRPILVVLGCPVLILTLGLGILLINTLLFFLTGLIGTRFGVGFTVDGFVPAFLGALIVSLISVFFNWLLRKELRD
jgi:putative membrane protein